MIKKIPKWTFHVASFIFGGIIFGLLIYNISQDWSSKIGEIELPPFVGAFLASVIMIGCVSIRWGIIVNAFGKEKVATWFQYFHIYSISRALGHILPKDVTDVGIRTIGLKKGHNYSYTLGGISVFIDRLLDFLTIMALLPPAILYWTELVNWWTAFILMVISLIIYGILLIFLNKYFLKLLERIISFIFDKLRRIRYLNKKLPEEFIIPDINRSSIIRLFLVSILKSIANIFRFVLYTYTFNLSIEPIIIIMGTPLAQVVYIFAFTPAGLGIFEAGWMGVLSLAHIDRQVALIYVIGQRILTTLFVTIIAILSQVIRTGYNFIIKLRKPGQNEP